MLTRLTGLVAELAFVSAIALAPYIVTTAADANHEGQSVLADAPQQITRSAGYDWDGFYADVFGSGSPTAGVPVPGGNRKVMRLGSYQGAAGRSPSKLGVSP